MRLLNCTHVDHGSEPYIIMFRFHNIPPCMRFLIT